MLLLMSAVLIAPLKLPTCPKQSIGSPALLSFAVTPCSTQQVVSSSCFSASYWVQDEFYLTSQLILQCLIGLLSFLLIFSKYSSPLDEIYRPPI
ncbi:hypothetical protein Lgra_0458 [Legionella gratiana]|uniref:Uncharacterized protein n=2 Tax=Legionella gratiana TaxID=45066 RepID=A0A378J8U4_9GAMM|nr:hypothetical protein Lgra_0458 [Legionella gratiana]STX44254.1 Uncharacterised protein [Legionella gratiana]